jgi:hypothetical protein
MSRYYTPQQLQFNTAYSQRLLHQNNIDSKIYLSRISNYILKAIGDDVVLSGLSIEAFEVIDLDILSFTLSPGYLIQDTTLIELKESTNLQINIRPYDNNNGYIIIYTDYQYLETTLENNLQLKISYITSDGDHIEPSEDIWDPNKNRILLYRYRFSKLPSASVMVVEEPSFNIFNRTYYLQGQSNFTNFSTRILDHASNSSTYGYASSTNAGHVRVGQNLNISEGTLSVPTASTVLAGAVQLADEDEAILLTSKTKALTPDSLRHVILNLKDIDVQVTDPGITLGTAMILS